MENQTEQIVKSTISPRLAKKRLEAFCKIARDPSPTTSSQTAKLMDEVYSEEARKKGCQNSEKAPLAEGLHPVQTPISPQDPPSVLEPSPPKASPATETHRISQLRRKNAKYHYLQPSATLKISGIAPEHLDFLSELLSNYGKVIATDVSRADRGYAFYTYSNLEESATAFKALLQQQLSRNTMQVSYVYEKGWERGCLIDKACGWKTAVLLTEINENSGSDKSSDGSELEKDEQKDSGGKVKETSALTVSSAPFSIIAQPGTEASQTEEAKTVPPPPPDPALGYPGLFIEDPQKAYWEDCVHRPRIPDTHTQSEASFDLETLNEDIEVAYPREAIARMHPNNKTSPSTAIQTETTLQDSDDLSMSGRIEGFGEFVESPLDSQYLNPYAYVEDPASNAKEFMRTQPVAQHIRHAISHTYTRSEDYALVNNAFMGMALRDTPANRGFPVQGPPPQPPEIFPYIPDPNYDSLSTAAGNPWYSPEMTYYDPISLARPPFPDTSIYVNAQKYTDKKPSRKRFPEPDRAKYQIQLENILSGKEQRATVMIRNIPNKYNQTMLLKTIDEKHKKQYDFFYLPIDFKNKCNVGYAFINFISPIYILRFYEEFNAKRWVKFNSEKICQLTFARIQGQKNLISHFHASSVMSQEDKKVRPLILYAHVPAPMLQAEYERELRGHFGEAKVRELMSENERVFGSNP